LIFHQGATVGEYPTFNPDEYKLGLLTSEGKKNGGLEGPPFS